MGAAQMRLEDTGRDRTSKPKALRSWSGALANTVATVGCGFLAVFASGCCTAVLQGSASEQEQFQGFSRACRHDSALYVAYATRRERSEADLMRHAFLKHGQTAKMHRGPVPNSSTEVPCVLAGVESREAALAYPDKAAVLWWQPDRYSPSYSLLWHERDATVESELRIDHWYIPRKEYPKLIMLTPVALALDVVTLPVQAVVFVVVWSVDWTGPYG
jgi:hypothetical protein